MMWKETYRLGVDRIDEQHIKLFEMTENLIKAIESNASAATYREAIGFLKEYVVFHFRDEEEYQASIQYSGIEEHKREHRDFTKTVWSYEKRLEENNFAVPILKDLAGTLTAWLIYHVADTDQKIVAKKPVNPMEKQFDLSVELFAQSAVDTMAAMVGLDSSSLSQHMLSERNIQGDVYISLDLVGGLQGTAVFAFSKELALNLVSTMTMMKLDAVDELVLSALCEMTNITCGTAAIALAQRGITCDIKPPVIQTKLPLSSMPVTGISTDTGIGVFEVMALVEEPGH